MELLTGLSALGLNANAEQIAKFNQYVTLLLRWNQAYNLISRDTEKNIISLHILDSLSVAPYLQGELLADVGSGAGLPGVPLAILHPDKQFYLVESNGKRTRFLTQCKIELRLDNLHIVKQRSLEYHPPVRFDTVLTRAFAEMTEAARLTQHLLNEKGVLLAMHGQAPSANPQLPDGMSLTRVIPLQVPGLDAKRHLVEIVNKE